MGGDQEREQVQALYARLTDDERRWMEGYLASLADEMARAAALAVSQAGMVAVEASRKPERKPALSNSTQPGAAETAAGEGAVIDTLNEQSHQAGKMLRIAAIACTTGLLNEPLPRFDQVAADATDEKAGATAS